MRRSRPGSKEPPVTEQPPPYGPPYGQPPGPPPGGQYDPRWGYGPPGVPGTPQYGPPRNDDNTWAIFAYVGVLVISFLAPLIIYLVKKRESPYIRFHSAQALNFQITLMIHLLAVAALCVPPAIIAKSPAFLIPILFPYLEALIGQWVFLILGAVKAGKGEAYRFPTFFCFRMIR
ncbi:DUF4870 domain-containing protein [Actinomadura sp. LCR2-06]|uniref:DUF4870 domain-containing protein n=1 Tax=Actinomadura violacea TaxID=2819934 RepID=A0ABS3S5Q8_9ACTN|nr:DUF4870 domain-containing protein [Actinomadura violacea]